MNSTINLVTPISHLFESNENANKIISHSDYLECRDRTYNFDYETQLLFHTDFQPIHRLSDKVFKYLENIKQTKKDLKLISFHAASSCDRPKLKDGMFYPGGKQYLRDEMLNNAQENFKIIKKIFGPSVDIAIENNNYYPTPAYEHITEADFINTLIKNSDLNLLFDIAHAQVTCVNKKIKYSQYKQELLLEKAIQLHICQHGLRSDGLAYDAHEVPSESLFDEVGKLINDFPNIKFLTIEYYKNTSVLIDILDKFSSFKNE